MPEEDLPVELPHVGRYEPTDTGKSPLANVKDWVDTKCPKCGGHMEKGLIVTQGGVVGARGGQGENVSQWWNTVGNKPKIIAYSCQKCGFIESYVEK